MPAASRRSVHEDGHRERAERHRDRDDRKEGTAPGIRQALFRLHEGNMETTIGRSTKSKTMSRKFMARPSHAHRRKTRWPSSLPSAATDVALCKPGTLPERAGSRLTWRVIHLSFPGTIMPTLIRSACLTNRARGGQARGGRTRVHHDAPTTRVRMEVTR